jgi:hypothetical protein
MKVYKTYQFFDYPSLKKVIVAVAYFLGELIPRPTLSVLSRVLELFFEPEN